MKCLAGSWFYRHFVFLILDSESWILVFWSWSFGFCIFLWHLSFWAPTVWLSSASIWGAKSTHSLERSWGRTPRVIQPLVCQVCVALSGAVLRLFFVAGAPYPAIIHVNKTLAIFSSHFWRCSRFSRNKPFMSQTLQLPIFRLWAKLCNSQFFVFFWNHFFSGKIGKRGSNFWACGEEAVGQTRFRRWFWRSVFFKI